MIPQPTKPTSASWPSPATRKISGAIAMDQTPVDLRRRRNPGALGFWNFRATFALMFCLAGLATFAAERHQCNPSQIDLTALSRLRVDVADSPDCVGGDN